jgi:hypothetical protein
MQSMAVHIGKYLICRFHERTGVRIKYNHINRQNTKISLFVEEAIGGAVGVVAGKVEGERAVRLVNSKPEIGLRVAVSLMQLLCQYR